jgi:hypothetical protein
MQILCVSDCYLVELLSDYSIDVDRHKQIHFRLFPYWFTMKLPLFFLSAALLKLAAADLIASGRKLSHVHDGTEMSAICFNGTDVSVQVRWDVEFPLVSSPHTSPLPSSLAQGSSFNHPGQSALNDKLDDVLARLERIEARQVRSLPCHPLLSASRHRFFAGRDA